MQTYANSVCVCVGGGEGGRGGKWWGGCALRLAETFWLVETFH